MYRTHLPDNLLEPPVWGRWPAPTCRLQPAQQMLASGTAMHSEYVKLSWNMQREHCIFVLMFARLPKPMHSEYAKWSWNMPSELCIFALHIEWLPKAIHSDYAKLFWNMTSELFVYLHSILRGYRNPCIRNMPSYLRICKVYFSYLLQILRGY